MILINKKEIYNISKYDYTKPEDSLSKRKGIIYCIYNKITNLKYIGKTIKNFYGRYPGGKWWETTHNQFLKKDYEKYGSDAFKVSIVESGYNNEDLIQLEGLYINSYNTFYPNGYNLFYDTDPLNYSENGLIYMVKLEEKKIYMFRKEKNNKNSNFYLNYGSRSPCSEEKKRKISLANKGSRRTPEQCKRMGDAGLGRKHSLETIEKRAKSLKGKHSRKVLQIDKQTNEIIREFQSLTEASDFLGLKTSSNITAVCKGKQKTAKGYIFKYKE